MVKTTQKSDLPWSAIFSVIVYSVLDYDITTRSLSEGIKRLPSDCFPAPERLLPSPKILSQSNRKISITVEIFVTVDLSSPEKVPVRKLESLLCGNPIWDAKESEHLIKLLTSFVFKNLCKCQNNLFKI